MEELTLLLDTYRPEVLEAHRVIRCGPLSPHAVTIYCDIVPLSPHIAPCYHNIPRYRPIVSQYAAISPPITPYCHDIA